MRVCLQSGLTALAAGLVAAGGLSLASGRCGELPRRSGEDVFALAFGEARLELSRSLEKKADEYFHGGAQHDDCGHSPADAIHHHHDHDDDDEDPAGVDRPQRPARDPWQWIYQHVHAQDHRHLSADRMRELLPWYWAACRLAPGNTDAFEDAAYVLAYSLGKCNEAVRLLDEGIGRNPRTPSLDFLAGSILFHRVKDVVRAEKYFQSAYLKTTGATTEEQDGDRVRVHLQAAYYLAVAAKQRGDTATVLALADESRRLSPDTVFTRDLERLLAPEKYGEK